MNKKESRLRRSRKTRAKIAELKVARLCVHRSNCHIYAQVYSGSGDSVIASASTLDSDIRGSIGSGGNVSAAKEVGKAIALKAIEKAILASELGLTPSNDGKVVRLNLPPLTEERRRDLARMVSRRLEECRVAIRNIRRDTMKDLKELEKEKLISEDDLNLAEDKLTTLTEKMVERVGEIGTRKEREIMEF